MRETEDWVKKVIAREEAPLIGQNDLPRMGRVLVTGGEGSIGSAIAGQLNGETLLTDLRTMDVRDERNVMTQFLLFQPDLVIHLAASKHAPLGEEDPYEVVRTNVVGTQNVLDWSRRVGARCVVASTCKACDPETAYGASKLVTERMALNEDQVVVRYYNVVQTAGNVFDIWMHARLHRQPLRVTDCVRRFVTLNEAISLTLWAAAWGVSGTRYTLTETLPRNMEDVLMDWWFAHVSPTEPLTAEKVQARRGDRHEEPRHADCERMTEVEGCEWISRIANPHDPV